MPAEALACLIVVAVVVAALVGLVVTARKTAAAVTPAPSRQTETEVLREAMADAVLGIPATVFKSPGGNVLVQAETPGKYEFSLSVVDMSPVLPAAELEADRQARVRANFGCSVMSAEEVTKRIAAYEAHRNEVHEAAARQLAVVAAKAAVLASLPGPQAGVDDLVASMQAAVREAIAGEAKLRNDLADVLPQFSLDDRPA